MSKKPSANPRRRVPDAPPDAERVSLHGPPFEDVLKGLLAVDPETITHDDDDDRSSDD